MKLRTRLGIGLWRVRQCCVGRLVLVGSRWVRGGLAVGFAAASAGAAGAETIVISRSGAAVPDRHGGSFLRRLMHRFKILRGGCLSG